MTTTSEQQAVPGAQESVFDVQPQVSAIDNGPEPSIREMVRSFYNRHAVANPDAVTAQYFAALARLTPIEGVAASEEGTGLGEVQCHCSEDDGVPDVGVSIGLGNGKQLWIGETLLRDGTNLGFVFHGSPLQRIVAPMPDGTDWQEIADLFRHHVAPALRASPSPAIPEGTSGEGVAIVGMINGVAVVDGLVRDNMRRWIVDGWTQGNMTWEEADEITQESAEYAADAVLEGLKCAAEDAALTPDATQTREAELEAALKPFSEACNFTTADDSESLYDTLAAEKLTWRDLRRARAALSAGAAKGEAR